MTNSSYFIISSEFNMCFWNVKAKDFNYDFKNATKYKSKDTALVAINKYIHFNNNEYYIEEYDASGSYIDSIEVSIGQCLK